MKKHYTVYRLMLSDGTYYVGMTGRLTGRLNDHELIGNLEAL